MANYLSNYVISSRSYQQQTGAVLVVSLVLLLVMTILGASNMKSSTLELRMATNTNARQHAFQAAESALVIAENNLDTAGYNFGSVASCPSGTASCYDDQCSGGRCFFGDYGGGGVTDEESCKVNDLATLPVWTDDTLNVWDDNTKHQTAALGAGIDATADYIVEFQCFFENRDPMYRITALGTSRNGVTEVMLQSIFTISP